jgi:hypothetical protein
MGSGIQKKVVAEAPDITSRILTLRGAKVVLDADLAQVYGVTTGALNRAVKRNSDRFPEDFLFKLTAGETMRCQTGNASKRNIRYLPYAFTEHGALQAANVLNSGRATAMSVYVIRAFVKMREQQAAHQAILKHLAEIDRSLLTHDVALHDIYKKLRPLLTPPLEPKRREIGFHVTRDEVVKTKLSNSCPVAPAR